MRVAGRVIPLLVSAVMLAAGVMVMIWLVRTRPVPDVVPATDAGPVVRAFRLQPQPHRISVTGFGTVNASDQWRAIAEVSGRVVSVEPSFESGGMIARGTTIVRIDPADYQSAVDRLGAEIRDREAALQQLDVREKAIGASLETVVRQVELAEREVARIRQAYEKNAETALALERSIDRMLSVRLADIELRQQLDLIPADRARLQAGLDAARVNLGEATRNLERATISIAPIEPDADGNQPQVVRCMSRSVEPDQFVRAGEVLGVFADTKVAELVVPIEPRKMRWLFPGGIAGSAVQLDQDDAIRRMLAAHPVPAEVVWAAAAGDYQRRWRGHVTRILPGFDPASRSIQLVIEVPRPFDGVVPGRVPPLLPDMFCTVRLFGQVLPDALLIPRTALHGDEVWLVGRDGRLQVATVELLALEETLAVVKPRTEPEIPASSGTSDNSDRPFRVNGLAVGDTIVLSDLPTPVPGMPLRMELIDSPVLATTGPPGD